MKNFKIAILFLFQRERCLENVQSIIHDHYYEQSSLNDKDEDSQKVNSTIVVSILPRAEYGPNDHRKDATHFTGFI